jgi:putative two-component system response regulator
MNADVLMFQVTRGLERWQLLAERRHYTTALEQKARAHASDIRRAYEEIILRLVSASKYRDQETGAHIKRVGLLSERLAQEIGWSPSECERIRNAAMMHDIGNVGIRDDVLRKASSLTSDDFDHMKTHTTNGALLLAGSQSLMLQMAEEIARSHHERWDGSGYPLGLAGIDIPESARIVAIVDVYDALTHDRVYRPALTETEVLKIMATGRETHFDPLLLDVFLVLLPELARITDRLPDERPGERETHDANLATEYNTPPHARV